MSFGFGPGDIVALIAFSKKVVDALEEQDGSQAQYRRAEQHCATFAAIMDQVKRRDLSNIPETFREQLRNISKNAAEHDALFKKHTIDRYERSLGKATSRSWLMAAPRKIQWAFGAAEDMEKLSQSLTAWMSAIQICILTRFLERSVDHINPLLADYELPAGRRSLALPHYQRALTLSGPSRYLDWSRSAAAGLRVDETVNMVSEIVFERLLSCPGLPMSKKRKIFTLDPRDSAEAEFMRDGNSDQQLAPGDGNPELSQRVSADQAEGPTSAREHDLDVKTPGSGVVVHTNQYLDELQFPRLTADEANGLLEHGASTLNMECQDPTSVLHPPLRFQENFGYVKSERTSQKKKQLESHGLGMVGFKLSELSGMSAKLSYQLDSLCFKLPYDDLVELSRRFKQNNDLLLSFDIALRGSVELFRPNRALDSLLSSNMDTVRIIDNRVESLVNVSAGPLGFVLGRAHWTIRRRRLKALMAEVENSRPTLSIVLQCFQMENDRLLAKKMEVDNARSLSWLEHMAKSS